MIKPTKHLDLNISVLAVASTIVTILRKKRIMAYKELLGEISKVNEEKKYNFLPAINLLYLLGLISYHLKNDTFEYVNPNEIK